MERQGERETETERQRQREGETEREREWVGDRNDELHSTVICQDCCVSAAWQSG